MYAKNTVIITADYQEHYISDAINSCLMQKRIKNIRVVAVFSYLKNESILKKKFKKYKNVFFLKKKKLKKFSTQDQLHKISHALKVVRAGNIYLLDGDDIFNKNKIFLMQKELAKSESLILNNYKIFNELKTINTKPYKKYKKNILYKKFINNWPDKISTSSISISHKLLNEFYQNSNPYLWKYLAIDAQLAIFFQVQNKIKYVEKNLTLKRVHFCNLDQTFSNILTKIYWKRRMEQHSLYKNLTPNQRYISLDYFFTKIIYLMIGI